MFDFIVVALYVPIILFFCILARFVYCTPKSLEPAKRGSRSKHCNPCKTCIFLGSGGHTAEMISILKSLPSHYRPRMYIIGEDDILSEEKVIAFERQVKEDDHRDKDYKKDDDYESGGGDYKEDYHKEGYHKVDYRKEDHHKEDYHKEDYHKGGYHKEDSRENFFITKIPRARKVGQSYFSSIFSTMTSLRKAFEIILAVPSPELFITNGPGTCIPLALVCYIPRMLGLKKIHIVYIESFSRVHSLSLSGKIMHFIADRFIVQWRTLSNQWSRAEYLGFPWV